MVNCPKRRARYTCWNCGVDGHMAASCTRDKPSKRARKQTETVTVNPTVVEQNPVLPANQELPTNSDSIDTTKPSETEIKDQPENGNQESIEETSSLIPKVVLTTPSPPVISNIKASPSKKSSKVGRIHSGHKPYERPVTRSQSVPSQVTPSESSHNMQLDQHDAAITDATADSSSFESHTDDGHSVTILH